MVAPGAGRPRRESGVLDIAHHRLALLVLDLVLAALGRDVDRGAVERGRDLAGEERAVVVGIVPGQAALVARVLPERGHELDGLHRALAVERRLAVLVGLHAAEVPEKRIGPGRRIAEGVAQRLAVGVALPLELRGHLAQLLVGLGKRRGADLGEPRLPIRDEPGNDAVGQGHEAPAHLHVGFGLRVEASLILGLPLRQVVDLDETVLVEVGPVVQHVNDVGPRARLDGGGDARLEVVGIDELEDDLGAERLRRLRGLALELHVAGGDEVHPAQDVESRALRECRRSARRQDACDARGLQKRATLHGRPPRELAQLS